MTRTTHRRRLMLATGTALAGVLFLSACSTDTERHRQRQAAARRSENKASSANDDPGEKVVIGFSGPAADHGWLAAINSSAIEEAKKYSDVELKSAEGTNDANQQISQVETFINDKVDAIVLLPTDGAALTDVATKAMEAGIPVVNVDREFSTPFAARTTVLGDNYGMGVSAGTYACKVIEDKGLDDAVVAEIAGIDALPLTQDRSKGFKDALKACGQDVDNRVAAEFTVESGEKAASNLLQAAPQDRRHLEPRRRPGCRREGRVRQRQPRRVHLHRRRRFLQRDAVDQGRRDGCDGHLPADPGRRRHQAGPPDRAGQEHVRPGAGGRPQAHRAGRSRGHQGQRRRVPGPLLRVLTARG